MLTICNSVLTELVSKIFKNCIYCRFFPDSIIPVHKNKDEGNNYCLVSLLPIFGKIFERTIFNDVFLFFEKINLLTPYLIGLVIPVSISFYQLFIVFTQILIPHLK